MEIGIAVALAGESTQLDRMVCSLATSGVSEIAVADATGDPATRARFAPVADKISAYFFEPDGGQSDGLNKAMAALSSPIVGWLNDDDFLVAGAAVQVGAVFADHDVVFGETLFFDTAARALGYHPNISPDPAALRRGCWISQPSCFFRRDLFERLRGLDRDLHYVMDWDLWLRMVEAGARFRYLPRLLSGVTLDRSAKTSHVSARRAYELYECGRRHGRSPLPAAAFAARAMMGGMLWRFAAGEAPPFPYFAMWKQRGGLTRAADLATSDGVLLFHQHNTSRVNAELIWRSGEASRVALDAAPFECTRLKLDRPMEELRAVAFHP